MGVGDDLGIRKAERMGTCLAWANGATCMRKLKIVTYVEHDGQGGRIKKKRRECKKHGSAIYSSMSGK